MSEEPLNDQSTSPMRPSGFRTAAWITLLILGILYLLSGLCSAVSATLLVTVLHFRGLDIPLAVSWPLYLIIGGMGLFVLVTGATYTWASFRIRRYSKRAAVVALVVSLCNVAGILAICIFGAVVAVRGGGDPSNALAGMSVYFIAVIANGVVLWLLIKIRREARMMA